WTNGLKLPEASAEMLVEKLGDENIWWRRNAQRLLIDRIKGEVPSSLIEMAQNQEKPLGRLHALWTLEGIKNLEPDLIRKALKDPEPGIRENAIKLAELHLEESPDLINSLLELQSDSDPKVRFQLLCTLGFSDTSKADQARQELLFRDLQDEWVQIAALSAPYPQSRGLLTAILNSYEGDIPAYATLVRRISAMAAASQDYGNILELIRQATSDLPDKGNGWQAPVL